jgi:hypothetical protein
MTSDAHSAMPTLSVGAFAQQTMNSKPDLSAGASEAHPHTVPLTGLNILANLAPNVEERTS